MADQPSGRPLDLETLRRALLALATDDVDAAVDVVRECDGVAQETRDDLTGALLRAEGSGGRARALGDRLRALGFSRDLSNEAYRAAFYLGGHSASLAENPLYSWFLAHRSGPPIDKWAHYFPVYHRHLEPFRGKPVRLLEIGVYRGGGLAMWQQYLGPRATVVGLDVDEDARRAAGSAFTVEIGDQSDPEVLRRVERAHGPFHIVVDDGGHRMDQQRTTAETLFPLLREGGVLVVEDTHTSYWPEYGGGQGQPGSFAEWVKARVDDLHAYHVPGASTDSPWASGLAGLHVYDSVVVLDRAERFPPFNEMSGTSTYLRVDRNAEAAMIDLVAARDSARIQVEQLEKELARLHAAGVRTDTGDADDAEGAGGSAGGADTEELRRAQAALRRSQEQLADLGRRTDALEKELASTNGRLIESWEQIKLMRKSVSWRVTAPLRAIRSLSR